MVELADTSDLGSDATSVGVQIPPFAPEKRMILAKKIIFLLIALIMLSACQHRIYYEPGPKVELRTKIIELSRALEGLKYRYGGIDIDGFDCSGLIYYVYSCFGIIVPRSAKEQLLAGREIHFSEALPGDILVFKLPSGWHSAIYIGENKIIHAPGRNQFVRSEELNAFWHKHLKRVVQVL